MKTACIIGAGASGLATVKAFRDRDIDFDCFEMSDRIGGLWAYENPNGRSAAYRSLHINTSRQRMQFADFPMPRHYPDFPGHGLIYAYFRDYAAQFNLAAQISFNTTVERAEPVDGGWRIRLSTGDVREYRNLVVANGHHWSPRGPEPAFRGEFTGIQLHSHHYRDPVTPHDLRGKRVLVVGFGNSAMDIACELGSPIHAQRVFLSTRRGGWVVPKTILGRPMDRFPLRTWMPFWLRRFMFKLILRLAVGPYERYGLPTPDHDFGAAHPTVSSEIFLRLSSGDIGVKPNLAELRGEHVCFVDGTVEAVDAIIWCTGYEIRFPFFDAKLLAAEDNCVDLFWNVFPPDKDNLAFIGLVQPIGAIMPIAELQAQVVGDQVAGKYTLPPTKDRLAAIEQAKADMRARYLPSKRHTIQVDFDDYMESFAAEGRAGHRRSA